MRDSIVNLAVELMKIPSISINQKETEKVFDKIEDFFKGTNNFHLKRETKNGYPSMLISNQKGVLEFDYLFLGHVDVVNASAPLFEPKIEGDRLYGRGAYDMKGMISVMLNVFKSLKRDDLKIGALIVGDEEVGGESGAKYWVEELGLRSKVVFDLDSAQDISIISNKAKAPFFVKLIAKGRNAHGAKPWISVDANEELMISIMNLRKHFPYYSLNNVPETEWVSTFHVGNMMGGEGTNIISAHAEAILDFRLTDALKEEDLVEILNKSLTPRVNFEILKRSFGVASDENNEILQRYKKLVEEETGKEVVFKGLNGATDGRYFGALKSVVITHQSKGDGAHEDGEWASIKGFVAMSNILKKFFETV
ncbi:MAG: Succinyl-diaminopimelate desuccinylase [Alphaproteobacteria bacterium ADurb.Bin438]|nr:MAG: Succinyl-diaminopimelate desuccinylase [Alphaproteobacteria bacterium ADurb.Bin438]